METIILKPEQFEISKVQFSEPKNLSNGGKAIYLNYLDDNKKKILVLQTPKMTCPYGLSCYDQGDYPKYSLEMSFGGMDDENSIGALYRVFESLDKKLIDSGIENSQAWFKKKKMSKEVISALYASQIKVSKDKETGEPNDKYPPTLKVKVPFKDEQFICDAYDQNKVKITNNFKEILGKGSKTQSLIQCVGLWFAGGKYGCSWKILQLKVQPTNQITSYSFVDESDDEDNNNKKDDEDEDEVIEDSDLDEEVQD